MDAGAGTERCEVMGDTLASLSSINVRGRIFSKLRKALGKSSTKPTKSLSANIHWSELSTYIRLALLTGYHSRQVAQNYLFVPEIVHLATLLAATGEVIVRKSIYGLVLNLLHSVYAHHSESASGPNVRQLLDDFTSTETIEVFGLSRCTSTSELIMAKPKTDEVFVDSLETLAKLLVRALAVSAGNTGMLR